MAEPSAEDKARYETLKKELVNALPKKRQLDKQLASIEVQIYNLEASYLTETANTGGNIIQGFDGYLKNQTGGRRRYEVSDNDRIFSNSSSTTQKSLELLGEVEESVVTNEEYIKQPTPGLTTVIVPPATRGQELSVAQQKRNREKESQRKKRVSLSVRGGGDSDEEIVSVASTSSRRATKRARLAQDD